MWHGRLAGEKQASKFPFPPFSPRFSHPACDRPHLALLFASIIQDFALQGVALGLAVHGEHACNGLAHNLNLRQLVGGSAGDLGDPQGAQLALQLLELGQQVLLVLATQLMGLDTGCWLMRKRRRRRRRRRRREGGLSTECRVFCVSGVRCGGQAGVGVAWRCVANLAGCVHV